MRQVLVCGYYGFGNTGDEAILAALLADLRQVHPGATITVVSGRPPATVADHGVEAVHWQDLAALVAAAESAELVVVGGGGLFQDHHGFEEDQILSPEHGGIGYYAGIALLARLTETPLAIYGVGVGPLHTEVGKRWTRIAFQHAVAATVRDQPSLDLLSEVGVDVGPIAVTSDPAWALPIVDGDIADSILAHEDAPEGERTIAVSVRPWGSYDWAEPLAAGLDRLISELAARVLFVPFQDSPRPHENDPNASVQVLRRMKQSDRAGIIRGAYSVAERTALIASSDLLVGMRLHSVIVGLAAGVPTVALAYDPKVTATMGDTGRPELCVPLDEVTAEFVVETAKRALELDPPAAVAELRRRAGDNREALTRGPGPLPELTEEAVAAMAGLLTARAVAGSEVIRLRAENANLWRQHREDAVAYLEVEEQRRQLATSKAVRAASAYWRARDRMNKALRQVGRRAPASVRPTLKRLAGRFIESMRPAEDTTEADPEAVRAAQEQIKQVLEEHPDVPGVVVYPPSIGWKVSLFQRPQQMALAFSKLGYVVFYGVDDREGIGLDIEQRADRVYLYPVSWAMLEAIGSIPAPLTPSYVYNFAWTRKLSDPRVIFEHIDELEVFTTTHPLEDLGEWYEEAIEGAEVVVASARDLLETVRRRRPDSFLCPNGVDYRHFAQFVAGEPPGDIADIVEAGRQVVGYYGALAEWVDYPLIRQSATELSDFEFVFIGPEYDRSFRRHQEVFSLPNVRWLGVKDYSELPAYLHHFDVATIPFVINEVTHSVSPLKLFEYMAGGRPVVTPNLRECAQYEAVQIAIDPDDYVAKLRHAATVLRHDPDHQALLRRTARANTWEMRVGALIDALARNGRL